MPVFYLYCTRKPPRNQGRSRTFHSPGRQCRLPLAAGRQCLHPLAAAGPGDEFGNHKLEFPNSANLRAPPLSWRRSVKAPLQGELSPQVTEWLSLPIRGGSRLPRSLSRQERGAGGCGFSLHESAAPTRVFRRNQPLQFMAAGFVFYPAAASGYGHRPVRNGSARFLSVNRRAIALRGAAGVI